MGPCSICLKEGLDARRIRALRYEINSYMPSHDTTCRPLEADDIDLVCSHRQAMFREAGREEAVLRTMASAFRPWLEPRLRDGRYFGFALHRHEDDRAIASIGLMETEWLPHPSHPLQDRRGYLLNLYVVPDFRRRGLGREPMGLADEAFRARGIGFLVLPAAAAGRPLYAGLGWTATTEMSRDITAYGSPDDHGAAGGRPSGTHWRCSHRWLRIGP
jgi:GNAT superfamily N-acetyltransferase